MLENARAFSNPVKIFTKLVKSFKSDEKFSNYGKKKLFEIMGCERIENELIFVLIF